MNGARPGKYRSAGAVVFAATVLGQAGAEAPGEDEYGQQCNQQTETDHLEGKRAVLSHTGSSRLYAVTLAFCCHLFGPDP